MTIKVVAERTGFSAPTLRYYEEIGLLPRSDRTPAGYRTYDERTIQRLAFIARAKQLGCTLDEIADLTTAWDGGRCGPIQERLRALVADKLAATEQQIAELTELSEDLRRAARLLELHRPEGACDDWCGCLVDSDGNDAGVAGSRPITLSIKPHVEPVPIACTLTAGDLDHRLADWSAVLSSASQRRRLAGGVRVEFGTDTDVAQLVRLVAAEQDCCQFLGFALTLDDRGLGLEVTGPADAAPIIDDVFGVAP